ncbi:MAG: hypothetical protein ABEJ28_03635 [Salinigranum sp.]
MPPRTSEYPTRRERATASSTRRGSATGYAGRRRYGTVLFGYLLVLIGFSTLVVAVLDPVVLLLSRADAAVLGTGQSLVGGTALVVSGGLFLVSIASTSLGVLLLCRRAV